MIGSNRNSAFHTSWWSPRESQILCHSVRNDLPRTPCRHTTSTWRSLAIFNELVSSNALVSAYLLPTQIIPHKIYVTHRMTCATHPAPFCPKHKTVMLLEIIKVDNIYIGGGIAPNNQQPLSPKPYICRMQKFLRSRLPLLLAFILSSHPLRDVLIRDFVFVGWNLESQWGIIFTSARYLLCVGLLWIASSWVWIVPPGFAPVSSRLGCLFCIPSRLHLVGRCGAVELHGIPAVTVSRWAGKKVDSCQEPGFHI
jgi:hypothetical protein